MSDSTTGTEPEMYFSVDIESDGEAPGTASMLSFGVVALDIVTHEPVNEMYATLQTLPGAKPNPDTMKWWAQHQEQYRQAREHPEPPQVAMKRLNDFVVNCVVEQGVLHQVPKVQPVFVANPAPFDFAFIYYYLHRFLGHSVFGFKALDMRSYAAGLRNVSFSDSGVIKGVEEWKSTLQHTHNALEDARAQADVWARILRTQKARRHGT